MNFLTVPDSGKLAPQDPNAITFFQSTYTKMGPKGPSPLIP